MIYRPTPEQIAASHALGEALMRFFLLLRPEPPVVERRPSPSRPVPEPARAVQAPAPTAPPKEAKPIMQLLIGVREAAGLLSISERTLWTLTAPRGPIPSVRLGRAVRYSVDDLREWAKQSRK